MVENNKSIHGAWNSHWVFILAATGSCIGLGAMWKFPYMAGEHGGGAFVVLYLLAVLLVGLPLLLAEVVLGRRARQSPVNAMRYLTREAGQPRIWRSIGWLGVSSGILVLSYYSVVAGWSLQYMIDTAGGGLQGAGVTRASDHFAQLLANPERMMWWHGCFLLLCMMVVSGGVPRLAVAARWMVPLLGLLLMVMLWFSYSGAALLESFDYLFRIDSNDLTTTAALQALGMAFFTLSLGVGAMMTYGAYIPDRTPVARSLLLVVLLDTLVALGFALVVFSVVFANPEIDAGAGPGLMFVTLPVAFANMPGGLWLGSVFFLLVTVAAWSSAISLFEPAVAWLVESRRCNRLVANLLVGSLTWVLGLGSIFSFNQWRDDINFYSWVGLLTTAVLLPLTGLLVAIFIGWRMKRSLVRETMYDESATVFGCWYLLLKYLSPVAIAMILIMGIYGFFQ